MSRITPLAAENTNPKAAELLKAVRSQMGTVPNVIATIARSTVALEGYLAFSGALGGGTLGQKLQEQIALTVAGANNCDYCASAHTMIAGMAGVSADEARRNLSGKADDPKAQAALTFVKTVVLQRADVDDRTLADVRAAGFSDGEIVEMIANIVANIFTNYLNHIADTTIDFPPVSTADL
ncbi:MAG: carboxymuconolactone decarboxylase family protein [Erythrobacter sp.]